MRKIIPNKFTQTKVVVGRLFSPHTLLRDQEWKLGDKFGYELTNFLNLSLLDISIGIGQHLPLVFSLQPDKTSL